MSVDMPADLRQLLQEIRLSAPRLPRFERIPGESAAEWCDRIAASRRDADRHALAHRAELDRAAKRLFGTTANELLPSVPADLQRLETHIFRKDRTGIGVSITTPHRPTGAVVIRLHGGGFWMGGGTVARVIERDLVDQLAVSCGATVLNIDYRLAPEHPLPAAIEDVGDVLAAVRDGRLGSDLDPRRIVLIGTSSGANVAAAAAIEDIGAEDALAGLVLIVSSLRLDSPPASMRNDSGAWQERQSQLLGYLGRTSPRDPRASPALSPSLGALPPVHAVVARYDEIADGGVELCAEVEAAGGTAEAHVFDMTHTVATPQVEAAWVRSVVEFVRRVAA